ncbi:unnamed protein product, partial [Adineta ricciae]
GSGYLKASWQILMNTLRKYLNHPLKKRDEQKFLYSRLYLFDEEYTLDRNQYLWQSYLDIQSQHQTSIWPQSERDLDCCRNKLNTQAQSWIPTLPPVEILDNNLKQFVETQNKRLSSNNEKELAQYIGILDENKTLQQILSFYLTPNDQV